ncbi:hypothetical protein [Flavobacterium sp. XGLA_31]|uniref:hypothetical protein n=1 Tax=Flavobacterium sp. XGLA_31 TaxID=3447666 RepID=UPI003F31BBF2
MATQGYKNQLSGTIGPVIFQQQFGKTVVRSKPTKVKQTQATRVSGTEFRYCSTWSKYLRMGLYPLWLGNTDSRVSQRLTSALYTALQHNTTQPKGERTWSNTPLDSLKGFECNTQSLFETYCKAAITTEITPNRTLKITLPELNTAQSIRYPDRCTNAELRVCITATDIITGELLKTVSMVFTMTKSTTTLAEQIWISELLPEQSVLVATAQLGYYATNSVSGRYSLNHKAFNPSVILWAGV